MQGFTSWVAGGGIKGGTTHGITDDFGQRVVDKPVSVHDIHATVLHLPDLHNQQPFFTHNGLEKRLTELEPPRVVTELFFCLRMYSVAKLSRQNQIPRKTSTLEHQEKNHTEILSQSRQLPLHTGSP